MTDERSCSKKLLKDCINGELVLIPVRVSGDNYDIFTHLRTCHVPYWRNMDPANPLKASFIKLLRDVRLYKLYTAHTPEFKTKDTVYCSPADTWSHSARNTFMVAKVVVGTPHEIPTWYIRPMSYNVPCERTDFPVFNPCICEDEDALVVYPLCNYQPYTEGHPYKADNLGDVVSVSKIHHDAEETIRCIFNPPFSDESEAELKLLNNFYDIFTEQND